VKSKAIQHSADLPIDPLLENNAQTRWRNLLNAFGAGAFSIQDHAAKEPLRKIQIGRAIEYHFIFLFDFETRMCQTLRELSVIREEQ
jgi:hypothetical protein